MINNPPKENAIHTVCSEFFSGRCSVDFALFHGFVHGKNATWLQFAEYNFKKSPPF